MKFLRYKYKDAIDEGWDFSEIKLSNVNLFVGDTASGKSRLINTIVNLGEFVKSNTHKSGHWDITFEHEGISYTWELISENIGELSGGKTRIIKDFIWEHREDGGRDLFVQREKDEFI